MVVVRIALKLLAALLGFLAVIAVASSLIVFGYSKSACTDVNANIVLASSTPPAAELATIPGYVRDEQITYLTFPEWYIVYSAREYAAFINASSSPADFPYNTATAQFWCSYLPIRSFTQTHYKSDTWEHVALITIGSSFSAENLIQEAYEKTVGNVSAWLGGGTDTPEDRVERETASDYAKFLDTVPWYRYPFFAAVVRVWNTPPNGPHLMRKWERRFALTLGYGVKGAYGWLMGKATNDTGVYAPADLTIFITVKTPLPQQFSKRSNIKVDKVIGDGREVLEVPRYQAFTELMEEFADENVQVIDISGNSNIALSAIAPKGWQYNLSGSLFLNQPISIDAEHKRVFLIVPTRLIIPTLKTLKKEGIVLEHIYDY